MKQIYKRKSDGMIREFELSSLTGVSAVILREGKAGLPLVEIFRKEFPDWRAAESFYYKLRDEKTKEGLLTEDLHKHLMKTLDYVDDFEDFMQLDLTSINFDRYEEALPEKIFNTALGSIQDRRSLIRFATWLTIFEGIQKGILAAVAEHGIKNVKKSSWMVTAGEHGQPECVVFRVKEGKILEPVPAEDFFVEEGGEFYHNLKIHLLNGQISFAREIIIQCLMENVSGVNVDFNKGIDNLVADVQKEFGYYLGAEDDDDDGEENEDDEDEEAPYFDLIHLEWSGSAAADERNAFAYPYSK